MGQIALNGMEFFGHHGYYTEEQTIGNKYRVDLQLQADLQAAAESDQLQHTVNYELLYAIVAEVMAQPTRLLEHLAQRILMGVQQRCPAVQACSVTVTKFNPPIGGLCESAAVTLAF